MFNDQKNILAIVSIVLGLSACTPAPQPVGDNDPFEAQNRSVHRANVDLDRVVVRPVSQAYGAVVPQPVRRGVSNFASNLAAPGLILNNLMQARIDEAATNAFRFIFNSTFGLGGMLDFATEAGIPEASTDFGETLYVWGVPEGSYTELPLLGPSTSRHVAGRVVDFAINPLRVVTATPESGIITGTRIGARIGDRYRYSDVIDGVLYESADSYAQSKLLYLQNRRFALSGSQAADDFDPYEDVYGTE